MYDYFNITYYLCMLIYLSRVVVFLILLYTEFAIKFRFLISVFLQRTIIVTWMAIFYMCTNLSIAIIVFILLDAGH